MSTLSAQTLVSAGILQQKEPRLPTEMAGF